LAEVFGPSKDSIALWVKQLEKRLAIVGGRKQNFITHSLTGIERPSY